MPSEDEKSKDHSKISLKIGEVQVELEGTYENIKKLMDKELFDFTKKFEETAKPAAPSPLAAPKVIPKAPESTLKAQEVAPKEKAAPPPPSKPLITSRTPTKKPGLFSIGKKTEKTGNSKLRWKPIAIALVLICIVLSAGLVGAIMIYSPMVDDLNSQIDGKDASIAALTSQITSVNAQLSALQMNLDQSNVTIANLQAGVENLNSVIASYLQLLSLNVSAYLFAGEPLVGQNASEYTVVFQEILDYAGYIGVTVESTSSTTYVQLLCSYQEVYFDHNVTVGTNGAAYFPVLPGQVEIRLGNTDAYTGDLLNATITAVYYY